jgi:hypothetical protein
MHRNPTMNMKRNLTYMFRAILIVLSLSSLSGCATAITMVGSGAAMAAEYYLKAKVSKTITCDFLMLKKAVFVALTDMQIPLEQVSEVLEGEQITGKTEDLSVTVVLTRITPKVTRLDVNVDKGFIGRDKATAQEIVHQTDEIVEKLAG